MKRASIEGENLYIFSTVRGILMNFNDFNF